MTDELITLREKILSAVNENVEGIAGRSVMIHETALMDSLCNALEDTGAPAHMRVSKEFRGEVG